MDMTATPLPRPNPYPAVICYKAYERCLHVEHDSTPTQTTRDVAAGPLLAARILGYLLQEIPSDAGREFVAKQVNECETNEAMWALAQFYIYNFVVAFKRSEAGVTPPPSEHPSRSPSPSYDETQFYHDSVEEATLDHWTAKKLAFSRDRYRCHFTGKHDYKIFNDNALRGWAVQAVKCREIGLTGTDAAHIIPELMDAGAFAKRKAFGEETKCGCAAMVWTVLSRFSGDENLLDDLNGRNIHRLENIITMNIGMHRSFAALNVWLEPTAVLNEYRPRSIHHDAFIPDASSPVIFTSTDPSLPVPSPACIALHTACARVANLSGAAEYVESMWMDTEDIDDSDLG